MVPFESASVKKAAEALKAKHDLLFDDLSLGIKSYLLSSLHEQTKRPLFIITPTLSPRLSQDIKALSTIAPLEIPSWETLPSEDVPPSPDVVGERLEALHLLSSHFDIAICPLQAVLERTFSIEALKKSTLSLKKGSTLSFDSFIQTLRNNGFIECPMVTDKGEFAIRGGIIDCFPVTSSEPLRIEFWGDEVVSIRTFDPASQKSIQQLDEVSLLPAQEVKKEALITDYLPKETLIIFDDLHLIEEHYFTFELHKLFPFEDFLKTVKSFSKIYFSSEVLETISHVEKKSKEKISFEFIGLPLTAERISHHLLTPNQFLNPEEDVDFEEMLLNIPSEFKTIFFCKNESEENKIKILLETNNIRPSKTAFIYAPLSDGLVIPDLSCVVFPTHNPHATSPIRKKMRTNHHTSPIALSELVPGDFVIHMHHGLGKFTGVETIKSSSGDSSERMAIEYADNGKLFIPFEQAHLITKYIGVDESTPKLHTIGSNRWKQIKTKTQQAVLGYAADLLKIYAERKAFGGFVYPEDGSEMKAFEESFPYPPTDDQVLAICACKEDMTSSKAMDRLICGDVGYGKTEVAMRAAFKAVADGKKQVAVLVPTTVLAIQHAETFANRMSDTAVNVACLSRFNTPKEAKNILAALAEGKIDIVVGTHRLLSKDVVFKDLGLIIIDEEQRFGVAAKEKLKTIKKNVDCLTLSATPIPRTLYMSLVGAKDMSVIASPPQDRLPIKSIVAERNNQLIKNALLRELARGGQAFFIHNRVETIFDIASEIKQLLPQARVVVGHGQMGTDEIDTVFHTFKQGQADILVATTIVENGIDIPNANTILIDRADRMGLSELYQLRGRVGRWNKRAYAYFLIPSGRRIAEVSQKRLDALSQISGYGGGMKIALRDLEIRGAGDLLGIEQSGHVASIGFHLYCKLLKKAIDALQGKKVVDFNEVKIEISVPAKLPSTYIKEVSLRLDLYQRLGESSTFEEVDSLYLEMKDRFGKPPLDAEWLYRIARLRVFMGQHQIVSLRQENVSIAVEKKEGPNSIFKRFFFQLPKDPALFEQKLTAELKRSFSLQTQQT